MTGRVLILGGTAEGAQLATALVRAGQPVISSLAGRLSRPRLPVGEVRVGGFGGADGLAEFLRSQRISAVIDATHPFAAGITENATIACGRTGTPLVVLRRPEWTAGEGDRWSSVPDLAAAAQWLERLDRDATVLLTVGRQGVSAFSASEQCFWLRVVEPPRVPLPSCCELIVERGPFTVDGELDLLRRLRIELLVTKNSGGRMTEAKLIAARRLGLPVLMVTRPALPDGVRPVPDVRTALAAL